MVAVMTRKARLTWPASAGAWKPGCSSIATPSSARSARRWPRSARIRLFARNRRASRVSSGGDSWMPRSLRLLDLLAGRLALVELGRELLAEGLAEGLLEEPAGLAALGAGEAL